MEQPATTTQPRSRLLAVTRWCAVIIGVIQLLLAGVVVSFLIEGSNYPPTPSLFYWLFAIGFVTVQAAILYAAWTVPRKGSSSLWFLAIAYAAGHVTVWLIELIGHYGDLKELFYGPDAELPPNEIMGRGWAVAAPVLVFHLAQLLNILPLILVVIVLWRDRRGNRLHADSGS